MKIILSRSSVAVGVRIVPNEYVVVENETVVRICVEKVGMSAEDITVTITSGESSPASAKGELVLLYPNVSFLMVKGHGNGEWGMRLEEGA